MTKVNPAGLPAMFDSHLDPHVVAQHNGDNVVVMKFTGECPFHRHNTDGFLPIPEGNVTIHSDRGSVTPGPEDLCVVPAGQRRRLGAEAGTKVRRIEPAWEPNTGDVATTAPTPHT